MYSPKFSITTRVLKYVSSIEASKEVIDHAPLLPYYERQFREDALVRTVHYGTHIEGNELDLGQAQKVIEGEDVLARDRDIQEVLNYRRVMSFIEESAEENKTITENLIKKLHSLTAHKVLPQEQIGEYRKTSVVIRNSRTGHVSFRPPPAVSVPFLLEDLLKFVNDEENDTHPVLKSAAFHYEFVRIHPFIDGNGRVARALSTFILFKEGYDIRKFFSLEEYFDKDAKRYYEMLQSVEKSGGDLTQWLEYFTEGLAIELNKIKEKIEKISVDSRLRQRLGGKPLLLSDRQLKIVEYIQETGFLQNQAFKSLFPFVSEDTILNELKSLLKAGIVKKRGVTKGAKYVLAPS